MFDFEKLIVYQRIKTLNIKILKYLYSSKKIDRYLKDQLKRPSLSVSLNLAEGTGRQSPKDKKHFYVIAWASCFESVAILDLLNQTGTLPKVDFEGFYNEYLEIVNMLQGLIKSLR